MSKCTVTRTHKLGVALRDRELQDPVPGPVEMATFRHPVLKRELRYMRVVRKAHFGNIGQAPLPDLLEPQIITFSSNRAMMVTGFEEIEERRYYQGWWIRWEDEAA